MVLKAPQVVTDPDPIITATAASGEATTALNDTRGAGASLAADVQMSWRLRPRDPWISCQLWDVHPAFRWNTLGFKCAPTAI